MIRDTQKDDGEGVLRVAQAVGLFLPEQLEDLRKMFVLSHETDQPKTQHWCVEEVEGEIMSVAFSELEAMTERTWNLRFIGVHPTCHRRGRGGRLLRYVEQALTKRAARLLLIDTAGIKEFHGARSFYRSNGYAEVASIGDFYADGVSKVTFQKRLLV